MPGDFAPHLTRKKPIQVGRLSSNKDDVPPEDLHRREDYRLCLLCSSGHFKESPPLSGECRQNPPRSFLDDGRPGRFFPVVRYDDWCAKHSLIRDKAEIKTLLNAIDQYRPVEKRLERAHALYDAKDFATARPIYQSLYNGSVGEADIAYRIGRCYLNSCRKSKDVEACEPALTWLTEASNHGHAAAPMSLGFLYAHGLGVERSLDRANELLKASADRGHPAAVEKMSEGGFRSNTD